MTIFSREQNTNDETVEVKNSIALVSLSSEENNNSSPISAPAVVRSSNFAALQLSTEVLRACRERKLVRGLNEEDSVTLKLLTSIGLGYEVEGNH